MTEERIIEKVDANGNVTERTIQREAPQTVEVQDNSGGGGIFWGLLLAAAIIFTGYILITRQNEQQQAQQDAISNAAAAVGEAVRDVGDGAVVEVDTVTTEQ